MRLCSLGDLLLDVVVRHDVPPVRGDDVPARTTLAPGGQAANVAAWARALGAEALLVARRADDTAGRLLAEALGARGIELAGPVAAGATGSVVSLVDADGERAMLSDPGVAGGLRAEEIEVRWLVGAEVLHVSGYALLRRPSDEAAARAIGAARAAGARVSVDLSAASLVTAYGPERLRERLGRIGPDVLFGGEAELAALGDPPPGATVVLKHGAGGCTVLAGGSRSDHPALPAEVIDTTGAGDAFAAGFLVGGIDLALEAAARCVATVGAWP